MKLTPLQRIRLVTYWMFHRKPPTRADQIKRVAAQLGILALIAAVAGAVAFLGDPFLSRLALIMLGLCVGMAISAINIVRVTLHQWPLMELIMDWDRVEQLKKENAPEEG